MKKYKLIKEYPGSDHVGIVVSLKTPNGLYEGYQYNYSTKHVENNPKYWEEVIEKDYEIVKSCPIEGTILSVKRLSDGKVFTVGDLIKTPYTDCTPIVGFNTNYSTEYFIEVSTGFTRLLSLKKAKQPEYEIISYVAKDNPNNITIKKRGGELHDSYWNIHSVERLSDGEVFTVGDRITGYWYKDARSIQTIKICIYTGSIRFEQSGACTYLSFAKKAKQPIFLTHDGKDIFPEDTVWYVNKENLYHDYIKAHPEVKFNSEIRAYFLTREEAEEYIKRNKVLFTTEDGVGIKRGDTFYFVDTDLSIGLSNTKYEKCDGRKYFSTFETAQYYMIVNAKVLSIEEFWEFVSKPGSNVVKQKALKRLVKERLNLK